MPRRAGGAGGGDEEYFLFRGPVAEGVAGGGDDSCRWAWSTWLGPGWEYIIMLDGAGYWG